MQRLLVHSLGLLSMGAYLCTVLGRAAWMLSGVEIWCWVRAGCSKASILTRRDDLFSFRILSPSYSLGWCLVASLHSVLWSCKLGSGSILLLEWSINLNQELAWFFCSVYNHLKVFADQRGIVGQGSWTLWSYWNNCLFYNNCCIASWAARYYIMTSIFVCERRVLVRNPIKKFFSPCNTLGCWSLNHTNFEVSMRCGKRMSDFCRFFLCINVILLNLFALVNSESDADFLQPEGAAISNNVIQAALGLVSILLALTVFGDSLHGL